MTARPRPNFVLLIGEDTGRIAGCYGDPVARTPHLDRLANPIDGGRRFDRAYTTSPVCAPSRSAIVTGRYPTAIGTHPMRTTLLNPPQLFTHALRDAGYAVHWPTKLDFNFEPTAGWCDDNAPWLDNLAAGRLGGDGRPFFAYANLIGTHESGMWPDHDPDATDRPEAVRDPEWLDTPRPVPPTDPASVPVPAYLPDTEVVRADLARHYDNLARLDAQVGRVLDALDASGQADDTIVVFLADHGRGMPREKRWCYAAGVRMPLILRGPGVEPGIDDRLVSWVDLAPTLLSLAGVQPSARVDGQPFLGPGVADRAFVFGGRDRMDEAFDRVRFANDGRFHYLRNYAPDLPYAQRVWFMEHLPTTRELRALHANRVLSPPADAFLAPAKPPEELYDLDADPDCVTNLAESAEHAADLTRLSSALDDWGGKFDRLGSTPERDLIDRGVLADAIANYRKRVAPLPPDRQIGPRLTVTEETDPR